MRLKKMAQWSRNKPLNEVCTLGIGGSAAYFTEVRTIEELQDALAKSKVLGLPYFILGKGSNTLFDDRGFAGVVIHNKIDFFEETSLGAFHVGAGYNFSLLGTQTARKGWAGLEFASGIPGTVGGAVFMNAGANGAETCESLISVKFVTEYGELVDYASDALQFSYRTSSFQTMKGAIASAVFQLRPCSEARSKQINIIKYRTETQPYSEKSAGCIFRNPQGDFAGALIEKYGLKGVSVGGARVSEVHGNFLVNAGGGTSKDFLHLIQIIKEKIKEKTGIELESEVRYIPYLDK